MTALRLCLALVLGSALLPGQDLKAFEKKVTEFTLPNGLHFIVVERHEAPVVSFHTYVNAGSVDDPSGETGIAHMFEHMAFKGTETIGTRDWPAEKKALEAVEDIYDRLEAERNKGPKANANQISSLELQLRGAITTANAYVVPNEFFRIIEENGGAGLNADTSLDYTEYFYSLPSNRIELWFLLESQRFLHPVFREFYKERDVVMEEERMRIESNPQGKLVQQFLATAFEAHPYRVPGTGWPSDVMNLRSRDARNFFEKYYVPSNITIAIVGDVDPASARRMAEQYFGPLAAKPLPPLIHTVEPPQAGNKTVTVDSPSQPILLLGYKRPDQYDRDDVVFDCLQLILSSGRTSILYRDLVQDKKIAIQAQTAGTFPDGRYPNEFVFFVVPALGHTVEENQKELDDVMAKFEATKVDEETLNRAKTKARAGVIRRLADNAGLASLMTSYYANYGDWRKLFTSLDDLNKVTAADVQRVAIKYFSGATRTVAYIRTQAPPPSSAPRPGVRK
ncbi:MAG TPA: pitrilysin family protein [Candidatus Sulfopaludibacter sp.]|jgi:predicted Zn-dependent peptidase|nr:pitrilysin family protein [Candidatus Sulfopaludibacter sp.]